jgi:trans-aconitate 2-methyltransferase
MTDKYTFGDNERASARLRKLADLYESDMRDLLNRLRLPRAPRLAVDLGCGPGYSTEILCEALSPIATVGLDSSERYIVEARHRCNFKIRFEIHDVTCAPFPVELPDLLFCRFLLTHLRHPKQALATWAAVSAPGAYLIIHETERMETDHPALARYYELLSQLQDHYGQSLELSLRNIAYGVDSAGYVLNTAKQIAAVNTRN